MFAPFQRSFNRTLPLFATRSSSSRRSQRRAELRRRPLLERPRGPPDAFATFTVTTIADNGSDTSPATGRSAPRSSPPTQTAGTYSPSTSISGTGGLHEIELASPLPAITNPVNIDGLYQRAAAPPAR